MKQSLCIFLLLCLTLGMLCGCQPKPDDTLMPAPDGGTAFGGSLDDAGAYDGLFDGKSTDVTVSCVSGTAGCYRLDGNVLTFTEIAEDSVYALSGTLRGNIVIDTGDDCKFELELQGFSLVCDDGNPIDIRSGDKVSLVAKKSFKNYVYDKREAVADDDETRYAAAIHADVDLELCGKGELTVISEHNNGIHTKDDLDVKNLTLLVSCVDNALKGNDSVTVGSGTLTLIATQGDGIKTKNSDLSSKGKQRGDVTVNGGNVTIYAACDGIDAAHDILVDEQATQLTIYTYSYSSYSVGIDQSFGGDQPTSPGMGDMPGDMPDRGDPNGGAQPPVARFGRPDGGMGGGRPGGGGPGGMGGGMDGNPDKIDQSAKGLKAANEIVIRGGELLIYAYDDCLHADGGNALENGETSLGHITIDGGTLTLCSNDDAIHADTLLTVNGGSITVTKSYEGLEATQVVICGGDISVIASDDGINGTATSGTAIDISGGTLYVNCGGDGLDSNSRTAYQGIVFSGGKAVILSDSSADSAIDTEQGYTYTGGEILAIMSARGMTNELTHCRDFSAVATKKSLSLRNGDTLCVTLDTQCVVCVKLPTALSATVVYLGSAAADISADDNVSMNFNADGVCWLS